jgi:hypothetical protein
MIYDMLDMDMYGVWFGLLILSKGDSPEYRQKCSVTLLHFEISKVKDPSMHPT